MSSPGDPPDLDQPSRPTSSPPNKVAFLVHSVHTLTENLPPEVDDKSLARQRRRRTSPEDQKILEDEFRKDPRPGKAARKDIVSRVSLGDKEVQIWFQNRRQNTRRKMRQEGLEVPTSDDAGEVLQSSSSPEPARVLQDPLADTVEALVASIKDDAQGPADSMPTNDSAPEETTPVSLQELVAASAPIDAQHMEPSSSQGLQIPASSQQSNRSGYIANRRVTTSFVDDLDVAPKPRKTLRRFASSHDFRLSITDDGGAKVVDRSLKSPSPEKPRASAVENAIVSRLGSLRRSHSAAGLDSSGNLQTSSQQTVRKLARTSTLGRSRDSRTWEFWCDSDARSSLQARAAQESSGSAIEAIGLIRSNSSRALRLNSDKMNSPNPGHHRSRDATRQGRPTLQRAKTHVGFIKSKPGLTAQEGKQQSEKLFEDEDFEHLNAESDKENNDPGSRSQPASTSSARKKKVLGENMQVMSHSSSLGAMMAREAKSRSSRASKSVDIHVDQEVSAFMGHAQTNSTGGDELDCVQSLLSLSQGNWGR